MSGDLLLMYASVPAWARTIAFGGNPMLASGTPLRGGAPDMALELYDGRLYGGELGG